jgi:hypothetical protein
MTTKVIWYSGKDIIASTNIERVFHDYANILGFMRTSQAPIEFNYYDGNGQLNYKINSLNGIDYVLSVFLTDVKLDVCIRLVNKPIIIEHSNKFLYLHMFRGIKDAPLVESYSNGVLTISSRKIQIIADTLEKHFEFSSYEGLNP